MLRPETLVYRTASGGRAARRSWKVSGTGLARERKDTYIAYRSPAGGWPRHSSRVAWRIVRCRIQLTRCRSTWRRWSVPCARQ
jgi:hypothetical protein